MTRMSLALLFIDYETPEWLMVAASEYERLRLLGLQVRFVFLSDLNSPPTKTRNGRKILLRQLNLKSSDAIVLNRQTVRLTGEKGLSQNPRAAAALEGQVIAYFRTNRPRGFGAYLMRKQLKRNGEVLEQWLIQVLRNNEILEVSCPNGRLYLHQIIRDICSVYEVPVYFTETSFIAPKNPTGYFLERFPVHDRISFFEEYKTTFNELSTLDEEEFAIEKAWFLARMSPRSASNKFSRRFEVAENSPSHDGNGLSAVIFTSSSDEFINLDPVQWPDCHLNQYDTFRRILMNLPLEMQVSLRIHPNLMNKSPRHFLEEINEVSKLKVDFPGLRVYWPGDAVNSYELAARSSLVIVSQSTMGLESLLMGKSVVSTMANSWDLFFGSHWREHEAKLGVTASKCQIYAFMRLFNSGSKGRILSSLDPLLSADRFPFQFWRFYLLTQVFLRIAKMVNLQIDRVLRTLCQ